MKSLLWATMIHDDFPIALIFRAIGKESYDMNFLGSLSDAVSLREPPTPLGKKSFTNDLVQYGLWWCNHSGYKVVGVVSALAVALAVVVVVMNGPLLPCCSLVSFLAYIHTFFNRTGSNILCSTHMVNAFSAVNLRKKNTMESQHCNLLRIIVFQEDMGMLRCHTTRASL